LNTLESAHVRERLVAFAAFASLCVPFGIAVHLFSELVELGGADASLAFSDRHRYLVWLGAASIAAVILLARLVGVRGADTLARILPFRGRGPAFFALSSALQFAVFAGTQAVEGSPLDRGAIALGIAAAVFASIAGAAVLGFACTRIFRAAAELAWFVARSRASVADRSSWHERRPADGPARARFYRFFVPNRPPPSFILR
jgi:hypothetical protein